MFLLLSLFAMHYILHYKMIAPILHAAITRSRFLRDGRERSHETLGGWTAKSGVATARFSLFLSVTFPFVISLTYLSFSDSYLLHGVKKLEKRKM